MSGVTYASPRTHSIVSRLETIEPLYLEIPQGCDSLTTMRSHAWGSQARHKVRRNLPHLVRRPREPPRKRAAAMPTRPTPRSRTASTSRDRSRSIQPSHPKSATEIPVASRADSRPANSAREFLDGCFLQSSCAAGM